MKSKLLILTILLFSLSNLSAQIVINEVNYRSENVQEDIEFIELHNPTGATVNISGWHLVDAVHYKFPGGSTIPAGGFLVVAGEPSDVQSTFGITGVKGPWTGKLSNQGDDIVLRDASYAVIDKVDYESWDEWPSIRWQDYGTTGLDGDGGITFINNKVAISIQKRHPDLEGRHGGSWTSDIPTPKAANAIASNWAMNPVVSKVSKSPNEPTSSDAVVIKADIEVAGLNPAITLEYQIVNPGLYITKSSAAYNTQWVSLPMNDNGNNGDADAGDGEYTVTIPANVQVHRRLIRYRVQVSSGSFSETYPDQNHDESNYAYYVYDQFPSVAGINLNSLDSLQNLQLLTTDAEFSNFILDYTANDYPGQGTLVYDGEVYDHIGFRARGKGSRHRRTKRNIKFDMNSEHPIPVRDDCGDKYKEDRGKLTLSGTWVNDANSHGLSESLIYKIAELNGGFNKLVDYTHFRVVTGPTEGGTSGDFYGVYLMVEDWGGDMLAEHDLPDGNIYTYKGWVLANEGENGPYGANNAAYTAWNTALGDSQDGCSDYITNCPVPTQSETFYRNNLDLDYYYADWAFNEITGNGETNYSGQHSYREYYNPVTQKWIIQCGDYDENFGLPHWNRVVRERAVALPTRLVRGPLKLQLRSHPALDIEYMNVQRSMIDLLFNTEQKEFLLDSESKMVFDPSNASNWIDVDFAKWNNQPDEFGFVMDYTDYDTDVKQWYSNWFDDRKNHLLNSEYSDPNIPDKPTISMSGSPALDNLTFTNSAFSDPNGNGSFAALEWRVGEWSDPSNPFYNTKCKTKYEATAVYESGEISSFSSSYTIPSAADLEVGRTYKVRVRYKDTSGRFSHWSDPVDFNALPAINPPAYPIVINEIMYNPSDSCGVEYIELYNNSATTVSLSDVSFTDGINYRFAPGATIAPNSYIVLADDSLAFTYKYGFSPYGNYGGGLDNGGELIELRGKYFTLIDAVLYDDALPWDVSADGDGPSLSLIDPNMNNSLATSWKGGVGSCGTPSAVNDVCYVLTINTTKADPQCFGVNDGTATVNVFASGGGPYTISWSHGPIGPTVTNLSPGTYTATITDQATNCSEQRTIGIGAPPAALVLNTSTTNPLCQGVNDGVASVSVSGGASGYSYSWSNGASGASASGLAPGSYTVTVTDGNGCTKNSTVTISSPTAISLSTSSTNPLCAGVDDGIASVTASGGASGYTYSWNNGASGATATGLGPGSYTVTVTDGNGCSKNSIVTISAPSAIVVGMTKTNPLCPGVNDGVATASASGGVAGYTYSWNNGATGATATGLAPGSYTVTVTDANGCTKNRNVTINPPANVLAVSSTDANPSVFGASDGTIVLSTTGPAVASYSWSNGASTQNLSNLIPGTYTVTIVDVNNCTTTYSTTISAGPMFPVAAATFTPNNGVAPINVSFNAGGSNDPDGTIVNYSWDFGDGNTGGGINPTHNYTTPGVYTVTLVITDTDGLTDTITMSVNIIDACMPPTNLTLISATGSTLIVSWTGDPDAVSYNLRYRDASIGGAWTNYPTTGTTAIIQGLDACTDYQIKVSNQCTYNLSSGFSPTQVMSTTNCFVCTAPVGLYQFNIQNISAIITWDVLVGASSYTYKFRKIGDPTWISETTPFPIAILFGISGCTDYEWTMETTCFDGSTAQSTTINNFSTQCKDDGVIRHHFEEAEIKVYPNPATDRVNIVLPELEENRSLQVFNSNGQIITTQLDITSSQFAIDIADWTPGIYIIKYGIHEETFIKL